MELAVVLVRGVRSSWGEDSGSHRPAPCTWGPNPATEKRA
jgi:hypothetical protein